MNSPDQSPRVHFSEECALIPQGTPSHGRPRFATRSISVPLPLNWVKQNGPVIHLDHQDPDLPCAHKNPCLTVKIPSLTMKPAHVCSSPVFEAKSCLRHGSHRERSHSSAILSAPITKPLAIMSPSPSHISSSPPPAVTTFLRRHSISVAPTVPLRGCCAGCSHKIDRSLESDYQVPWSPGARKKKLADEEEASSLLSSSSDFSAITSTGGGLGLHCGILGMSNRRANSISGALLKVDEIEGLDVCDETKRSVQDDEDSTLTLERSLDAPVFEEDEFTKYGNSRRSEDSGHHSRKSEDSGHLFPLPSSCAKYKARASNPPPASIPKVTEPMTPPPDRTRLTLDTHVFPHSPSQSPLKLSPSPSSATNTSNITFPSLPTPSGTPISRRPSPTYPDGLHPNSKGPVLLRTASASSNSSSGKKKASTGLSAPLGSPPALSQIFTWVKTGNGMW